MTSRCLVWVLMVVVAGGCTARRPAVSPAELEETLAPLFAESVEPVAAYGELELEVRGRRVAGKVRVLLVGDRARLDVELPGFFGLLGGTTTLWVDATSLRWREPGASALVTGDDPVLTETLGRPVRARDVRLMVLGLRGLWPYPEAARRAEHLDGAGNWQLELSGGRMEAALIQASPAQLSWLELRHPSGLLARAVFDAHRRQGAWWIPARVQVRSPPNGNWIRVRWKRYRWQLDNALSQLAWPAD